MSLAKQPSSEAVLSDIRNDNGTDFIDCGEHEKYITNYYTNVYKKVDNNLTNMNIESFLGDVATHPDVLSSKLSNAERDALDLPLSVVELDKALKKSKMNTAPGIDGISNRFI
jgi:hypothetical protein